MRGRFAPSPTGPLHAGSLVAAVGSFLHARALGGEWLLRIEDLDTPRCVAGADDTIRRQLEACALTWDGEVLYQSQRREAYAATIAQLQHDGHLYPCTCSRREITERSPDGRYPGTCRPRQQVAAGERHALRLRTHRPGRPDQPWQITFHDPWHGCITQNVECAVGDFVVYRADGLHAYQLAVVVDDAFQAISHVVRGHDLLDNTPRQIVLQQLLGLPTPAYAHLPLLLDRQGRKLSKQEQAPPVDPDAPTPALRLALRALGYPPPAELEAAPAPLLIEWALNAWRADNGTSVPTHPTTVA